MSPAKKYYKIGEVVERMGVESHVLRTWEADFPKLKPRKNSSGHRVYSADDLELIEKIKHLIQVEGFTIAGAARQIQLGDREPRATVGGLDAVALKKEIAEVKTILENLKRMLDRQP